VPRELLNDHHGTFVRQILRSNAPNLEERARRIRDGVDEVLERERQSDVVLTHTIAGKQSRSSQYDRDYISELKRVLDTYASGAKTFLEWGAGYTTQIIAKFAEQNNADLFLTIDANQKYLDEVVNPLRVLDFLRAEAPSMTGPCINDRDSGLGYSTFPLSLGHKFDFIYIDGRRRLARIIHERYGLAA
jgi:hypothetical protein